MCFSGGWRMLWSRRTTMDTLLAIGVLIPLAGCNSQTHLVEVEGTVLRDGEPLRDVLVVFLPDPKRGTSGPRSCAATDERGRFRLTCDDQRRGAVAGWHRVILEDLSYYKLPRNEEPAEPVPPAVSRVPHEYRAAATTPLEIQVTAERPAVDLRL